MQGFPVTNMVAYIDPNMLLPHSSTLISFSEWLVGNKDCALPDQMTIAILVLMHQKKISTHPIFSNFVDQADAIPRNILTLSDLHNLFLTDTGSSNRMMYRCATNIRDKQMQNIKTHVIITQRGYAFQYFLLGTVYPLSYANARADTGHTQIEVENGKDWGTGADNTMAKFLAAQSPANNNCPDCVDISMYAPAEDWRGTTEAGTWHAYTVTYNQNGKAHGRPGELPIPMYCNEMPTQDSRSGGSAVNIAGRLCSLLPRNTEVDQAGKRTFTIKNEKTGNFENAEQRSVYFFPLLCLAQNCESDNQLEQTLNVV